MTFLRIALLGLALGMFGAQTAAGAHPLFQDLGVVNLTHERLPRLRRPVLIRSETPIRVEAIADGAAR